MDTNREPRILILGGCHVLSYPPDGFFDLVAGRFPGAASRGHVKASQTGKILAAVREEAPDLLVLQLGNFENPYPLFDRLQKKLLRSLGRTVPAPATHVDPYLALPAGLKIALDRVLSLVGCRIANPAAYNRDFERILTLLCEELPGRVLAFSPFPSPAPWMQHGRSLAHRAMREHCARLGVPYLDLFARLPAPVREHFHEGDAFHLNARGHRVLFEMLEEAVPGILAAREG